MGFYSDGALQREVPKILERIDPVPWTPEEIERRRRSGSSRDKRIADVIKASRGLGWTDNEYQLFLLTQQDERGRRDGHVTLSSELANQRTGREAPGLDVNDMSPLRHCGPPNRSGTLTSTRGGRRETGPCLRCENGFCPSCEAAFVYAAVML